VRSDYTTHTTHTHTHTHILAMCVTTGAIAEDCEKYHIWQA